MKKLTLLVVCLIKIPLLFAQQEQQKNEDWGIKFNGFVNTCYWYDTRQVLDAREYMFLFYPLKEQYDVNGNDINAHGSFNMSAIAARLTGKINGPDAFGAKTSGVIEGDFTGTSNADINGFRLRHAYSKLKWKNTELLCGQYWHPMFVPEVFPNIASLNTGAPFQPFIRNPQVALTQYFNKFNISLAAITQRDNANLGPMGYSSVYLRNAIIPNFHLQLQYKNDNHVWGVAGDYKVLKPRIVTDSLYITNETLPTYAVMAYWKYTKDDFVWRSKAIYGQNLTEHLLLGGYAVKSMDSLTLIETYTPTNHLFLWGNITYGKKVQFSLYGGYAKNFGTTDENIDKYYSRGSDIDYMYRVAPCISFVSNKVKISTELEYTSAAFGTPNKMGIVENAHEVDVLRALVAVFYFF